MTTALDRAAVPVFGVPEVLELVVEVFEIGEGIDFVVAWGSVVVDVCKLNIDASFDVRFKCLFQMQPSCTFILNHRHPSLQGSCTLSPNVF